MVVLRNGNIFEAMRLVLTEHRASIEQYESGLEANQRKQSVISQDRYAKFSLIIAEAVMNETRIRITLFNKYRDE